MHSGRGGTSRLLLGGLAAAGVLVAHGVAYLLAIPNPSLRQQVLESTGHGSRIFLIAAALGVAVAGLARLALGPPDDRVTGRGAFTFAAPRLAVLQVAGFALLEFTERWYAHADLAHTLAEPAVVIGLVLQIVAALVGSAIVRLLAAAICRLTRLRGVTAARARDAARPRCRIWVPAVSLASGGATLRGPPGHARMSA